MDDVPELAVDRVLWRGWLLALRTISIIFSMHAAAAENGDDDDTDDDDDDTDPT